MTTRIGIDIGGTFTDLVFLDPDGRVLRAKVLSTPDDYSQGIAEGLAQAMREGLDVRGDRADHARHDGRDQRAAGRQGRARRAASPPRASATSSRSAGCACPCSTTSAGASPRRSCRAVCATRSTSASTRAARWTVRSTRPQAVATIEHALAQGVDAIAVCLINAYANGAHEVRVRELDPAARREHPGDAFERAPARDPRVRAHEHDRRQRLRAAARQALSRKPRAQAGSARACASRSRSCSRAAAR